MESLTMMLSNAYRAMFPILLEMMGLFGSIIGIYLGFYCRDAYDPRVGFDMMSLWSIACTGFTSFLGSLFFSKSTSKALGWKFGAHFQIEKAFFHLAFAIAVMTVYFGNWGFYALLAITFLYLLNLFFESSLHIYDVARYQAKSWPKYFHILANLIVLFYLGYFSIAAYSFNQTQ
ncbi:MAG: hypothetical protein K9M07_06045 [Simkaniaceae bacterium]|nr:hypothetical protein [Simkaniaceae bacterium]